MPEQPRRAINDPLLARLDRLAQRREASPPFPPPAGGRPVRQPAGPPSLAKPVQKVKRRHPARSARIGALVVSCASTGGLSYLFATSDSSTSQASAAAGLPAPIATSTVTSPATSAAASPATAVPATAPAATTPPAAVPATTVAATTVPATVAQTGAFDGTVVNTRYGPVQVQAQITNGSLTEVAVVQYPDGDRRSRRINEQALPALRTEALTAQSATVDTVSGATYTSDGYTRSLQSALDAARAAGVLTSA